MLQRCSRRWSEAEAVGTRKCILLVTAQPAKKHLIHRSAGLIIGSTVSWNQTHISTGPLRRCATSCLNVSTQTWNVFSRDFFMTRAVRPLLPRPVPSFYLGLERINGAFPFLYGSLLFLPPSFSGLATELWSSSRSVLVCLHGSSKAFLSQVIDTVASVGPRLELKSHL